MMGTGLNYFINSQGFPRIGMYTVVLGAVLNIVRIPCLSLFLTWGSAAPPLPRSWRRGLRCLGAALLTGKKAIIRPGGTPELDGALVRRITALGMSGFIMSATNCLVQIVCNTMLRTFGGDLYIGIMTILNSVREVVSLPVSGITNGSQPVLGFNYGAGEYGRVRTGIVFTTVIGAIYTVAAWIAVMVFPQLFIRLFNDNPDMLASGAHAIQIYFFGFFTMTFQFAGQCTFVALGRSKMAIFFSLLRKAVIVVPLTLLLPGAWSERRVSGGAHLQRGGRHAVLRRHDGNGLAGAGPKTKNEGNRGSASNRPEVTEEAIPHPLSAGHPPAAPQTLPAAKRPFYPLGGSPMPAIRYPRKTAKTRARAGSGFYCIKKKALSSTLKKPGPFPQKRQTLWV
ncbi:MAG: MATE family efflux transporter [Oscillospiraceae bacterium]